MLFYLLKLKAVSFCNAKACHIRNHHSDRMKSCGFNPCIALFISPQYDNHVAILYCFICLTRNLTFLGNAQVIEKLHKSGAVLNIETKFEKRTSLHIASSLGLVDVVQALLDLRANPNKTDIYGSTPLQVACMAGQILY